MEEKKLKVVIWCGNAANHKALSCKIATKFLVAGIVIDTHVSLAKRKSLIQLLVTIMDRLRFRKIFSAWSSLLKSYEKKFPEWPNVPTIFLPNINAPDTKTFTTNLAPDLIVVSGTGLIKADTINTPSGIGIVNLHTGLSPYVKGGPNCTNWCIAENNFHLIGNTIMWLNEGIDSGNIISTEAINIIGAKNLLEAHTIVMEHAHDLYIRSIRHIFRTLQAYNSVPQSAIAKGKLYLTKMWTADKKKALLYNWKRRHSCNAPLEKPIIVPINK